MRAEDGTTPGEQAAESSAGMAETAEYEEGTNEALDDMDGQALEKEPDTAAAREEGAEIVDSGTYQGIDWSLDTNGHLVLTGGEGVECDKNAPWHSLHVRSAEVRGEGWKSTSHMFEGWGCNWLEEIDLSGLNTENVTDMSYMFSSVFRVKTLDLSGFDTSNVINMAYMFSRCDDLIELNISGFNTSNVVDMEGMFNGCFNLTSLNVSGFDTSKVINMRNMFDSCGKLKSIDVSNFNTKNVTDMSSMFCGCNELRKLDVSSFDTSNVTDMSYMFGECWRTGPFYGCYKLKKLDLSNFDTSNVTDMSAMFCGCQELEKLNLSSFDTSNVTDMSFMFGNCSKLSNINVSDFNTGNVVYMRDMFSNCSSLKYVDVSGFDTTNVTEMDGMFLDCINLEYVDLSRFDTTNTVSMREMFQNCGKMSAVISILKDITEINANHYGNPRGHENCFTGAAVEPGSKIIVKYGGGCTLAAAEKIIETKSDNSHVYLEGSEETAVKVVLDRMDLVLKKGEIANINFEVFPIDAWEECIWSSDNPSVVTVSRNGTIRGLMEGQAVIKVTIGSVSAECNVTVGNETAVEVADLVLNMNKVILTEREESIQLSVSIMPENATNKEVIWSTSNPGVVTVDENGLVTVKKYNYGYGYGTSIIKAMTKDGRKAVYCTVIVSPTGEEENEENLPKPGRVVGTSRYSTALSCAELMRKQLSSGEGDGKFSAAVVACADNFPDALAGSTLAASVDAPILLVGKFGSGTEETLSYINENVKKDGMIYLLGRTSAIPESVARALVSFGFWEDHIKTLAGSTRYETNMKIIEETAIAKGTDVVIVSGKTYADSLSISGIAGAKGMPIFLAADKLSGEAVKKIEEIAPKHIYLIGGKAAVSDEVYKQAETLCAPDSVKRIAGASRYATSLAAAEYFGMENAAASVFAYGGDFPDGLTGGAFAASLNAPVILVSDDNYKEQAEFLANSNIEHTYIMGGTSVISDETMGYLMK